ncbi:MAG TPA: RluA family pseudouridine synthase [Myxococcota bacterium]
MTIQFVVEESIAGLRGDHVIRARHPDVDREFALKLLKGGRIRINGAVATLKTLTTVGGMVTVDIAEGRLGPALSPRFIVLKEDRGLVILDKSDGIAMHDGPNVGDLGDDSGDVDDDDIALTTALRERYEVEPGFNGPSFPGRLDRPTSGLVLAAMSEAALRDVEPAWRAGLIKKEYVVVVRGKTPSQGLIDIPLAARRSNQRGSGMVEPAKTGFTTVARGGGLSVVVAELHTGRTHQIRRHFKAINNPLVGDTRYGWREETGEDGLMLHAWRLRRGPADEVEAAAADGIHWPERMPKQITAPWPDRIRRTLLAAGIDIAAAEAKAKAIGKPKPEGEAAETAASSTTAKEPAAKKAAPKKAAKADVDGPVISSAGAVVKNSETAKALARARAASEAEPPPKKKR